MMSDLVERLRGTAIAAKARDDKYCELTLIAAADRIESIEAIIERMRGLPTYEFEIEVNASSENNDFKGTYEFKEFVRKDELYAVLQEQSE